MEVKACPVCGSKKIEKKTMDRIYCPKCNAYYIVTVTIMVENSDSDWMPYYRGKYAKGGNNEHTRQNQD